MAGTIGLFQMPRLEELAITQTLFQQAPTLSRELSC
ncbi:hypothetical protein Q644_17220 [Brucella intermedia 229E]|uniref:Uncharacterized protein n=1 Tax=Brucella intermedia 229E TaxID=1337887 RepID=U4V8Q5_9HYPH|nr:hypothetical protein Q644_17220 [Brucella intermedia 229E]